jgi:Clp amino terminal domain, pathogenicity island component
VRNVPDIVYEALRIRAEREGRSIGSQAIALLQGALLHGSAARTLLVSGPGRAGPWERFGAAGREAVVGAQAEARRLGHHSVGTEHLLLALLHEGAGHVFDVLRELRIEPDALRAEVTELAGTSKSRAGGSTAFAPEAKKVLELALREALALGQPYIGEEHLLLGLAAEEEGVAGGVLRRAGADVDALRLALIRVAAALTPPPREGEFHVVALAGSADHWAEQLNEPGGEGWELYSIISAGDEPRAVFRRVA